MSESVSVGAWLVHAVRAFVSTCLLLVGIFFWLVSIGLVF